MNKQKDDFLKFSKSKGIQLTSKYQRLNMPSNDIMPYVIEESSDNSNMLDVFSRLMKDQIIYLGTEIDSYVANVINAQLLFLESTTEPETPIWIYINSPGGTVYDGMAIYDVMNMIKNPVYTVVAGLAASMAFVISTSGTKGNRYALKHSRLMMHQPLGGAEGQATDIHIVNKEMQILKNELYSIIAVNTNQKLSKIKRDGERDFWMRADKAIEYGAVDHLILKH